MEEWFVKEQEASDASAEYGQVWEFKKMTNCRRSDKATVTKWYTVGEVIKQLNKGHIVGDVMKQLSPNAKL